MRMRGNVWMTLAAHICVRVLSTRTVRVLVWVGEEVEMEEEEARPETGRVVREYGSSELTMQSKSADTRIAHETVLAIQFDAVR